MEWQPIETAPRDGTRIIGWNAPDQYVMPVRWQGPASSAPSDWPSGWRADVLFLYQDADITHWMPLPPPPQGDKQ